MDTNVLYYGDNLDILRYHIPDKSIDLIYLDPPFNSKANYNILFKEPSGEQSAAQIKAFGDTWHWDRAAEDTFQDIILNAPPRVAKLVDAVIEGLGRNDVTAYLVMMTIRLVELHRVLKDTGSLYLHCDPTASHYLKMVLDAIFGPLNFRNEIIWKRSHSHNSARRYGPIHDTLLFYSKASSYKWSDTRIDYEPQYVDRFFKFDDNDGRGTYWTGDLTGTGIRHGETGKAWRGFNPTLKNRHWMYPPSDLDKLDADGRIFWPKKQGAWPKLKRYLSEAKGVPLQDIFDDIYSLATMGGPKGERLGYPTQKPEALLERIINASSNEGDIVLDPFCGCGTALVVAQKLNRKWIGIDITHLAIAVMKSRLEDSFPGIKVDVMGEPEDLSGAKALARQDRYQFQWWALSKIKAKPFPEERRKGADKGIDGVIDFVDRDEGSGKQVMKRAVVSVKSGHVHVRDIRELKDVASQQAMGVFITLEPPTREMKTEAVSAGNYHSPLWDKDYPKIQILTIAELLGGKGVDMPPATSPYARAPKVDKSEGKAVKMI